MANRILTVDLSSAAKDFENVAIEQGWPLLDKSNTNYQVLQKWLGPLVAEPERQGDRVGFYVRNAQGARLECGVVLPITERDLVKPFRNAFTNLSSKINEAKPATAKEQQIHRAVRDELQSLASDPARLSDRRCYLFKYRDENDRWKVVWCPGYRRKDAAPAAPIICTNPNCSQLFLRRSDGGQKCPGCQVKPSAQPVAATGGGKGKLWAALVILLLLALGLGWWYSGGGGDEGDGLSGGGEGKELRLAVDPGTATVPTGGRVEFVVTRTGPDEQVEDVTSKAVAISADPKIAAFGARGTLAMAKMPGETTLTFHVGDLFASAKLLVQPPTLSDAKLDPSEVVLGVGSTQRVRMLAVNQDGTEIDLTTTAEWISKNTDPCFVFDGLLEGLEPGTCDIHARYPDERSGEFLEASAKVTVVDAKYKSLEVKVNPAELPVGQVGQLSIVAVTEADERMDVTESSQLQLELNPPELVRLDHGDVHGQAQGAVTLSASFFDLKADTRLTVGEPLPVKEFRVSPEKLDMTVGEVADIEVAGSSDLPTKLSSSDPKIAEISETNRVMGRSVGNCSITVSQGDQEATVAVTVASSPVESIAIEPARISVRVDDSASIRVLAATKAGTHFELQPEALDWVRLPRPDYADVDQKALTIQGRKSTGESAELLTLRYGPHETSAEIKVSGGPIRLELLPKEPTEVPVGQVLPLHIWSSDGADRRVEVPAGRVEWLSDSVEGLTLENGQVRATQPGVGPLRVSVSYQDQKSNEVEIRSTVAFPAKLTATAIPSDLAINEAGRIAVSATSLGGQPIDLDATGFSFASDDEDIVRVDPATGGFRAVSAGTGHVTVSHPSASGPVSVPITVTESVPVVPPKPATLRLVTGQSEPISLPVGVVFDDFRVESVASDGSTEDVTSQVVLRVEGDVTDPAIAVLSGRPKGLQPGKASIRAEHLGITSENALAFEVTDTLDVDAIRIAPTDFNLAIHDSTRLSAIGFKNGRRIGVITDCPTLEWESSDNAVVLTDGAGIVGMTAGTATVSASVGTVVSDPSAAVRVLSDPEPMPDLLAAVPRQLTLHVDESVSVGTDVFVRRGDTDFSDSALVSPAARDIVAFNSDSRTLQGISPGHTDVSFVVGDQVATMGVDVVAAPVIDDTSRVVLEPSSGLLAVGEQLHLRAFLISADGERVGMTASVVLGTADANIATVNGHTVQGQNPGEVQITGRLPGVAATGSAVFQVRYVDFDRLVIEPPRLDLSIGQRRRFNVYGVDRTGRHLLGPHPDLTIAAGSDGGCIDLAASAREVLGVTKGRTTITSRWREKLEKSIPVKVAADPMSGLVLRPDDSVIRVGETTALQTFARHGRRLQPLSELDGVQFRVDNPSLAETLPDFHVRGLNEGTTRAVVQYGAQQATARIQVAPPRTTQPPPPAAQPVRLRFIPNVARFELGTPGDSIRVIRVNADGSEEDVDNLVTLTVREPSDVIQLDRTGSGPVIRPRKIGQTQIDAQLGSLRTDRPLLVDVTDDIPDHARLRVSPDPLRLQPGRTGRFSRVQVYPGGGKRPVELPYEVTASPSPVIEAVGGNAIRAKSDGSAVAQIRIKAPESKYDGLHATATVQVGDTSSGSSGGGATSTPPGGGSSGGGGSSPRGGVGTSLTGPRLELSGPSLATVGEELRFRVDLVSSSGAREVTHDSTTLVLADGDTKLADVEPGCRIVALKPGTITLHARRSDVISGSHDVRIDPLASSFARLELDIDPSPLAVGEARDYRLWGYPSSGARRQELTRLVTTDPEDKTRPFLHVTVLEPNPGTQVAVHEPPSMIARQNGTISLEASLGAELKSNRVDIHVAGDIPAPIQMFVSPSTSSHLVGETTPPLEIQVRSPEDRAVRPLDPSLADVVALDSDLLAPAPDLPGQFVCQRPGTTQLRVSFRGLEELVDIHIRANRFTRVEVGTLTVGRDTFSVAIHVQANRSAGSLEYRCVLPGGVPSDAKWIPATVDGDIQKANLSTPEMELLPANFYSVEIEARDRTNGSIEKYPFAFELRTNQAQRVFEE